MCMLKQVCVLAMVTVTYAAYIPDDRRVLPPSLLAELQRNWQELNSQSETTSTTPAPPPGRLNVCQETTSTTPAPPPGRLNVCQGMCPKWCEKVKGKQGEYTHCHYLCGNLCDSNSEVLVKNHFIGNPGYEVVPSEFQFELYDTDKDKFISRKEFVTIEQIAMDEAAAVFSFTDVNRDGFISKDEFKFSPLVFTVQMAEELSNMAKVKAQTNQ